MRRLVLWGHHLDEYIDMFGLTKADLSKRFLEFNSGASAVNVELKRLGSSCVSVDNWFDLEKARLVKEIECQFDARILEFKAKQQALDLSRYGDLEKLITYRREGVATFLADYEAGVKERRYIPNKALTKLPFEHTAFDCALAAHTFFSDVASESAEKHVLMIQELARVAKEVRIFPLVDAQGIPSPLLGPVLLGLQQANYGVEVRKVTYHLQPRGNAMLRVWAQQCSV